MSDCRVPEPNGYDVARLRIEFEGEETPWMYPLALNGRVIRGVYVDGERYERVRECENASRYAGEFKCSECGAAWKTEDMDLVEPTLWIDGVADYPSYCQHCGARVKEGGDEL